MDYADRTQTCLPLFTNAIHIASRYGSYVGRLQVEEGMILRQLYSDRSVYFTIIIVCIGATRTEHNTKAKGERDNQERNFQERMMKFEPL